MPDFKLISGNITRNQEARKVTLQYYERFGDLTCKVLIISSDYLQQSEASLYVWSKSDLRWNLIHSLDHSEMATTAQLIRNAEWDCELHFEEDMDTLFKIGKEILS